MGKTVGAIGHGVGLLCIPPAPPAAKGKKTKGRSRVAPVVKGRAVTGYPTVRHQVALAGGDWHAPDPIDTCVADLPAPSARAAGTAGPLVTCASWHGLGRFLRAFRKAVLAQPKLAAVPTAAAAAAEEQKQAGGGGGAAAADSSDEESSLSSGDESDFSEDDFFAHGGRF